MIFNNICVLVAIHIYALSKDGLRPPQFYEPSMGSSFAEWLVQSHTH